MIASACGKKTTRHRAHRRAGRRLNGRATSLCSEYGKRAHQASRQSSTKCRWNESQNADDPRHFTLIRQENCDSKKPGQRPSMFCDLRFCPAGTPVAQRMADCRSCRAATRSVRLNKPAADMHHATTGRRRIPRGG